MSTFPEREILEGHWTHRRQNLKDFLDVIPFTANQRETIEHNLDELERIFKDANKEGVNTQ